MRMGSFLLALLGVIALPLPGSRGGEGESERGADPRQLAEAEQTGFPVVVGNDLGMRFRLIPTATYEMGSPPDEEGRDEEEALHEVQLSRPYYVQETEVTNAQFRRFRPEHDSGRTADGASLDGDDQPAVEVSHEDAVAFAAWLARQDPRFVYRLPTESEWEHACRAGCRTAFSVGARVTAADATLICAEGEAPPGGSSCVASHPANAWGLFDLHGNVAEWCHDRYGPYPLWALQSPQGASEGTERVVRGGSWATPAARARCAARSHLPPDHRCGTVGFRLAFGLGYGRTEYGRYDVEVHTVDPTVDEGEDVERPGWPMYMISVMDRLTDRANQIIPPRWTHLEKRSPTTLHLAPGVYYVYCYRMEGEKEVRGIQVKFHVPGTERIHCPIPRPYQLHPQ